MSTNGIKVALYARVSTEEQTSNFSLAAQLEMLRKNAAENRYEVFDEYVDGGYSGTSYERPAFQKLIQDAEKQKFQLVLVYRLDRFFRNNKALLTVSDHLEKLGIGIRSITEPFDTSNHLGKFVLSLFGSIAQLERDTFLERSKLGRLRRAREGYYSGTQPTKFGYQYNKETRKLEIHQEEAAIIKLIFKLYNGADSSLLKVAKKLHRWGYKTKEGKRFHSDTVHSIVRDEVYTGLWYANRYTTGGKQKPKEEWIEVKVPAIISKKIFERSQQLLQLRRNYSVRNAKYNYLLQGLVRCGDCGSTVAGTADKQYQVYKGKKYGPYFKLYYRCTHFVKNIYEKKIKCRLRYMQAEPLETVVWRRIEEILTNPERISEAVEYDRESKPSSRKQLNAEIARIDGRKKALDKEEQRILEAYRQNIINIAQLKQQNDEIRLDKGNLEQRGQQILEQLEQPDSNEGIKHAIDYVAKVRSGLGKFTFESKKQALRMFNTKITTNINGVIDILCTLPKKVFSEPSKKKFLPFIDLSRPIYWPLAGCI